MLLATLALLLPQQTYSGAGFTLEYPAERFGVEEGRQGDFYVLKVFDPAARTNQFPPVTVLTFMAETERDPYEFRDEVSADLAKQLRAQGAEITKDEFAWGNVLDQVLLYRALDVKSDDGPEWAFRVFGVEVRGHLVVVSYNRPADREAQRSKDVLGIVESLTSVGFGRERQMQFDLLGLKLGLSLAFDAASQHGEQLARLEARSEFSLFSFLVSREESPTAAALEVEKRYQSLLTDRLDKLKIEEKGYGVASRSPALYAIGGRTARGVHSDLQGNFGVRDAWRHQVVFAFGDRVCSITAILREDFNMRQAAEVFSSILDSTDPTFIHGMDEQLYEDGLGFRHDSQLERRRVETEQGTRWEFRRKGVEHAKFGEVWVEIRDDIMHDDTETERAEKINAFYCGDESLDWVFRERLQLLGKSATVVRTDVRTDANPKGMAESTTLSCSTPFGVGKFLVAGSTGRFVDGVELGGLMKQVVAGLQSTADASTARYEDAGVVYDFDPSQCRIESSAVGNSSTVTVRNTVITTRWAPVGGGLLGSGPGLEEAVKERVSDASLTWSLVGETTEPQYGPAGFGEIPAQYGYFRRTNAEGAEWDHIVMVADSEVHRVWVEVEGEVVDTAAAEFMTAMLATLRVK